MKIALPLDEMSVSDKISVMEDLWADLTRSASRYSPPDWHGKILEVRSELAKAGEVGFTDWETAKKEISYLFTR